MLTRSRSKIFNNSEISKFINKKNDDVILGLGQKQQMSLMDNIFDELDLESNNKNLKIGLENNDNMSFNNI